MERGFRRMMVVVVLVRPLPCAAGLTVLVEAVVLPTLLLLWL